MTLALRVMPPSWQNALIASAVTPRRRRPESVSRRGSSQPWTQPSVTRRLSLRFDSTVLVMLRREYSHTTGL